MSATDHLERERQRVASAQSGDQRAWRELFDEYYPRLYSFMRVRVNDDATAEDLAAEAFVDAFRGLPRFRWRNRPFGAWLFKVARNRLRMHYRALSSRGVPVAIEADQVASARDETLTVDVRDALERLPVKQREAIELRYLVGLSGAEAAAAMGMSHGAFRQLLHRASREFKGQYGSE